MHTAPAAGPRGLARRTALELEKIPSEYGSTALRARAAQVRDVVQLAETSTDDAVPNLRRACKLGREVQLPSETAGPAKERRRHLTGADVTDQYFDLRTRLRSDIALRDRLQQPLTRAATLDDVLILEKQIARLQADIDALQARIDQLKSQAQPASLEPSAWNGSTSSAPWHSWDTGSRGL